LDASKKILDFGAHSKVYREDIAEFGNPVKLASIFVFVPPWRGMLL
jgi:hypothetical protein